MARIGIVTDSSACLPASVVRTFAVRVLPIGIHLASEHLADGMPDAADRVYDALGRGDPVKTSAPSPLDYLSACEEADTDATLIVTPAEEFTVMHRNAVVAAQLATKPVEVVDSRTAAAAQGLVVAAGGAAAQEGSLDRAAHAARDAAARADLVAALDTVEFVRRSGHVPSVAFDLAERLGIRPVFRLHAGRVERLSLPRSEAAALRRIAREFTQRSGPQAQRAVAFHAASPARADALVELIGVSELVEFSPSMGIHTGPGVVGVAFLT